MRQLTEEEMRPQREREMAYRMGFRHGMNAVIGLLMIAGTIYLLWKGNF